MTSLILLLWAVNIILDAVGQIAFKMAVLKSQQHHKLAAHWGHMLGQPWIWLGIGCYVVEFVFWLAFLTLVPVSIGVMLASFNIVVIMIAGRLLFKEYLTTWRLTGILLIAAGVSVIGIA